MSAWIRSFYSSSFIPSTLLLFLFSLIPHTYIAPSFLVLCHSLIPLTRSHSFTFILSHSHSFTLLDPNSSPSSRSFSPLSGFTQLPFRFRLAYSYSKHTFDRPLSSFDQTTQQRHLPAITWEVYGSASSAGSFRGTSLADRASFGPSSASSSLP